MKNIILITFIIFLVQMPFSCNRTEKEFAKRDRWFEGGPGAPNAHAGRNFYTYYVDRYPEYGLVSHSTNTDEWSPAIEKKLVIRAIEICRIQFTESYHENHIVGWDSFETHKPEWLPPGNAPAIRIRPDQIVIIVRKLTDLSETNLPLPPDGIPHYYKVGYIFNTSELFDRNVKLDDLFSNGFRDEYRRLG